MVERSAHDGGGRLHPRRAQQGGTDGGAKAAGTACPQEDGRDRHRSRPRQRLKKKATSPTSRQRRKARGGDAAGRRRSFAHYTALGAGRRPATPPSTGCGPSRSCGRVSRPRTRPGAIEAPGRDRGDAAGEPAASSVLPRRARAARFPRAEPERSTDRRYDDLQTGRLGGRVSSRTTKTRPLRLSKKSRRRDSNPWPPLYKSACSDQLSYSGSRHIVVSERPAALRQPDRR